MIVKETGNIKVQIKFKLVFLSYCSYYKINSSGFVNLFLKTMAGLSASVFYWFLATCGWNLGYTHYSPLNITRARDLISVFDSATEWVCNLGKISHLSS